MSGSLHPDILFYMVDQGFLDYNDYKAVSRDFHFLARENAKEVIIDENGRLGLGLGLGLDFPENNKTNKNKYNAKSPLS